MPSPRSVLVLVVLVCVALALTPCVQGATRSSRASRANAKKDGAAPSLSSDELETLTRQRLGAMREMSHKARDNVIYANQSFYESHVAQGPRAYSVLIQYQALSPFRKCSPCKTLRDNVQEIAEGYRRTFDIPAGVTSAEEDEEAENMPSREVFFVVLDYDHATELMTGLKLDTTPFLAHVGPTSKLGGRRRGRPFNKNDDIYNLRQKPIATDAIVQFMTQRTGIEVDTSKPLPLFRIVFAVVSIVGLGWHFQHQIAAVIGFDKIFYTGFLGTTLFTYSGLMYTIIRKSPWTQATGNPDNPVMWLYPQSRHQLGQEGLVVGGVAFTGVLAMILLAVGVPRIKSRVSQLAMSMGALFMFLVSVVVYTSLFRSKMGMYPFHPLAPFSYLSWGYFSKFG